MANVVQTQKGDVSPIRVYASVPSGSIQVIAAATQHHPEAGPPIYTIIDEACTPLTGFTSVPVLSYSVLATKTVMLSVDIDSRLPVFVAGHTYTVTFSVWLKLRSGTATSEELRHVPVSLVVS